jgi:hypothetical protein
MRPMTSDEVFVLLGATIAASPWVKLDDISRDTPVHTLLEACDLDGSPAASTALNAWFSIALPQEVWETVLPPPKTRTLGEVCDLVARHATTPVIEPVNVMGDRSLAAGAFLAIRRILADAGVNVVDLRPSSPLDPYLREHADRVLPRLWRFSPPGACPVQVDQPLVNVAGIGLPIVWVMAIVAWCAGLSTWQFNLAAGAAAAIFWYLAWLGGSVMKRAAVRFGDARTFRDLARIIAGERCAYQGFPVVMR